MTYAPMPSHTYTHVYFKKIIPNHVCTVDENPERSASSSYPTNPPIKTRTSPPSKPHEGSSRLRLRIRHTKNRIIHLDTNETPSLLDHLIHHVRKPFFPNSFFPVSNRSSCYDFFFFFFHQSRRPGSRRRNRTTALHAAQVESCRR